MTTTTIKVPSELRDRLAERARRDHLTLAGVIEKSLEAEETREFWGAVHAANASLEEDERLATVSDAILADDLADAADDALSAEDAW